MPLRPRWEPQERRYDLADSPPVSGIRGDRMNSVSRRGEGGGCRRTMVHFAGDDYDHEALLDDQRLAAVAA